MSDYDSIEGLQEQGLLDSKKIAVRKTFIIAFFYGAICVIVGPQVFSIWLDKKIHLDASQIGILLGMKGFVAIFYKPVFGWLLDKTQLRINFIITLAIGGLAAGPFFQFVYKPLLLTHNTTLFYTAGLLGGAYFGYVIFAGGPAIWSYCGRYIEAHGGTVDKFGAAYRAGAIAMGFVVTMVYTIDPILSFYVASFSAFWVIVTLLTLKVKPFDNLNTRTTSKQKIKFADLKQLITNPRFYVLAFFAIAIMVIVYAQFGQVGRYNLSFWPDDMQTFGLKFNAYASVVVGVLLLYLLFHASTFIRKVSPIKALIVLGGLYGVSLLALGLASVIKDHSAVGNYMPGLVVSIIAREILELVNPFTMVVVLSYVTTSFNQKIVGVAFLSFNFMTALVGSFGAGIVGKMFKEEGWRTTYLQLAVFIFIATVILAILIMYSNKYDKKRIMAHLKRKKEVES